MPPNAFLVGILGLALPGLGHVVAGRPGKGFFYFCVVGAAFVTGLWMTGLVAVNLERDPLWFVGQALAGLPTLAVWHATKDLVPTERLATFDLGMLYTGVAGLLNVIGVADALGIVEDRVAEADLRRRAEAAEADALADTLAGAGPNGWPTVEAPAAPGERSAASSEAARPSDTAPVPSQVPSADAAGGVDARGPGALATEGLGAGGVDSGDVGSGGDGSGRLGSGASGAGEPRP